MKRSQRERVRAEVSKGGEQKQVVIVFLIFVTVIKFKVGRRAYVFGTSERKVGSGSAAWSGTVSAGIFAGSGE